MVVIGVSGGPDSMALLDMTREKREEIVVCHVNYGKRDTAKRDEEIVRAYCGRFGIEVRTLRPVHAGHGNFQAWAREVRYDFFVETAKEVGADKILIAHQEDDLLETYLFQRERGMLCDWYGLKEKSSYKGFVIERPLLAWSKEGLEAYCTGKRIVYGFDESNGSDVYARNRIRHHVLPHANRQMLLREIEVENGRLQARRERALACLRENDLHWLDGEDGWFVLDMFVWEHGGFHLGRRELESLVCQLRSDCLVRVGDFWLERRRGRLRMERQRVLEEVRFENPEQLRSFRGDGFAFSDHGKAIESLTLKEGDFPVRVRSVRPGDEICLRYGRKKVSRFFVDRGVWRMDRMVWPVVTSAAGEVIFVPGIGCDVAHWSRQSDLFMIKFEL